MLRDQIFQIKKTFPLIYLHLHHLLTTMPVLHLPIPKNQFPINKDNFTFVKVNIEESLEYMELQDMSLNEELDPLVVTNLHFAAFKDLVPVPDLQSQFLFQVCRPKGDDNRGLECIQIPPVFQAGALCLLSLQEASTASRLVTPFQVQPCKTNAWYNINSWHYQYETLAESYEGTRWAFPSETYNDHEFVCIHYQGFEIIHHSPHLTSTHSYYCIEQSLEPNWLLCNIHNHTSWETRKELDTSYQHIWNKAFDSYHCKLSCHILTSKFHRQCCIQQLIKNATSQEELDAIYLALKGRWDIKK